MEVKEITSIEQQATELIQNISLIKEELSKKVSTRQQFEQETKKIVRSLTGVVEEINNLKTVFATLGKTEMIELFTKIDETNKQLTTIIPQFDTKVEASVVSFESVYKKMGQSNDAVEAALSKSNEQITSLMETVKQYDQRLVDHFGQINVVFQQNSSEVASVSTRIQQHEQALAQYFDHVRATFTTEIQRLENKVAEQETIITANLNTITEQLKKNEQQQQQLANKMDSILNWLESNGQILVANSRTGLFWKKQ